MQTSEAPILSMLTLACRCCCTFMPPPYFIENSSAWACQIEIDKVLCAVIFLKIKFIVQADCRNFSASAPPSNSCAPSNPSALVLARPVPAPAPAPDAGSAASKLRWACVFMSQTNKWRIEGAMFGGPNNGLYVSPPLGYNSSACAWDSAPAPPEAKQPSDSYADERCNFERNEVRPMLDFDGVYLCVFCDLCDSRRINPNKAALTGRGLQQEFYLPPLVLFLSKSKSLESPGQVLR